VEQSGEHGAIGLHRVLAGPVALAVAREIGRDHAVVFGERRERVLPRDARRVETDAVEQDYTLSLAGREIPDPDRFVADVDLDSLRLHADQPLVHTSSRTSEGMSVRTNHDIRPHDTLSGHAAGERDRFGK